jgi:hypothetical protein
MWLRNATVVTVAAVLVGGCTVAFWHPDPGPDGQPDGSSLPDAVVPSDGPADVLVPADAGSDAAPPVPDGGCPVGSKECAATCVPLTSPVTGCATQSCDPCA